jgi:nucleotide-binding universal stress UspA family protein
VDGSPNSQHALRTAIDLAKANRAELTILVVQPSPVRYVPTPVAPAPIPSDNEEVEAWARQVIAESEALARSEGVTEVEGVIDTGNPIEHILSESVERNVDLIVMGARGLSPVARLLLGSVSDGVVHHAHCAVLIDKL